MMTVQVAVNGVPIVNVEAWNMMNGAGEYRWNAWCHEKQSWRRGIVAHNPGDGVETLAAKVLAAYQEWK
jgi:hypothetical protein